MRDRDREIRRGRGARGTAPAALAHQTAAKACAPAQAAAGASRAQGAEWWAWEGREGLEAAACCARSSQVCVGTALVELVSSACQPRPRLPLPAAPALLLAGSLQSAHGPCCACVFAGVLLLGRPRGEKLVSLRLARQRYSLRSPLVCLTSGALADQVPASKLCQSFGVKHAKVSCGRTYLPGCFLPSATHEQVAPFTNPLCKAPQSSSRSRRSPGFSAKAALRGVLRWRSPIGLALPACCFSHALPARIRWL